MKKKLLMYFLMLMLAFSFTACSGNDDDSSSKKSERDKDDEDENEDDEDEEDEDDKKDKDKEDEKSDDEDEKSDDEDEKSNDEAEKSDDEDEKSDDEDEKDDDEKPTLNPGTSELSNDLADFQFALNDEVYQLPMWFSEFDDLGWEFDDDSDYKVDGEGYTYGDFVKDDLSMWVDVSNYSINKTPIKDCVITSVELDADYLEDTTVKFANDIELLVSTTDDVIAAYGEPDDIYEGTYSTYYTYYIDDEYGYYQYYEFIFDVETNILYSVDICNDVEVEGFDNTLNLDTPDFINDYEAPTQLGTELFDDELMLEDNYYILPCPVAELLDNGFEIPSYYDDEIVPAGQSYYFSLTYNEDSISVSIENFSDYATTIENCYVVGISYDSQYNGEINLELSSGIKAGITEDELIAIFGDIEYDMYEGSSYKSYSAYDYADYEFYRRRSFTVTDGIVTYVDTYCDKSPVE